MGERGGRLAGALEGGLSTERLDADPVEAYRDTAARVTTKAVIATMGGALAGPVGQSPLLTAGLAYVGYSVKLRGFDVKSNLLSTVAERLGFDGDRSIEPIPPDRDGGLGSTAIELANAGSAAGIAIATATAGPQAAVPALATYAATDLAREATHAYHYYDHEPAGPDDAGLSLDDPECSDAIQRGRSVAEEVARRIDDGATGQHEADRIVPDVIEPVEEPGRSERESTIESDRQT